MATLPCPRCGAQLEERRKGYARLDACDACGGVWLEREAAQRVIEHLQGALPLVVIAEGAATLATASPDLDARVKCPLDAQTMVHRTIEGVTVDVCHAHGTWFDAGEVRRIANAHTSAPPTAPTATSSARARDDSEKITLFGFIEAFLDALSESR